MSVCLFIDTNVIIDFLSDRKPFASAAAALFEHGARKNARLYIAAVSFNNTYYILRKHFPHKKCIQILKKFVGLVEIVNTSEEVVTSALDAAFNDLEDAIQYHTACSIGVVTAIVTRNPGDFKPSELPIWSPQQALSFLENKNFA
jgi:predicted nucleic acid-binding protein